MTKKDHAYLLINLGTPDSPRVSDVRKYLAEFLMDPFVIDINPLARFLLIHGIILRTRPAKSAHAYQKIWTDRGSPLKFHLEDCVKKLRPRFPELFYAMRYGNPSIASTLSQMKDYARITVLPLYPQYAWSSSVSCIEKTKAEARKLGIEDRLNFIPPFYSDPDYLEALSARVKNTLDDFHPDHVLVSYHGIPERQLNKADPQWSGEAHAPYVLDRDCCEAPDPMHRYCYRHHCFQTTAALAKNLGWSKDFYTISFQSRLGRTPWIQPFTDHKIEEFGKAGKIKRLAVICPSFVSDCLETIEEIGIRAKSDFEALAPGSELKLVPCLNSDELWIEKLGRLLEKHRP